MFKLIKNALVYAPEFLGRMDVLIAFDKIATVGESLECSFPGYVETIDAEGSLLIPGLIDQHVHITGGGGEGGFSTRTKEIAVADIVERGITTVVGVLGTDGVARSLEELYAKAKALEEDGISTYMYTGSYQVPVKTITGSIQRDIVLIDKVIGVGEIAMSDHRSFYPSMDEMLRIVAEARVGGMISGKAGIVHLHMGDGGEALEMIFSILEEKPVPAAQFLPTHVNRNARLLEQALKLAEKGGHIDFTAGFEKDGKSIPAYEALKYALDVGINIENISMSSDGNGSIPVFSSRGELVDIDVASCKVLLEDVRTAIFEYGIPAEKALKCVTSNPARMLKLDRWKGYVAQGRHADLVIVDRDFNVKTVFAMGRKIVENGKYFYSKHKMHARF